MNSLHHRTPAAKAARICVWFFFFCVFPSTVLLAIKHGDNLLNFAATLLVGTICFLPLVFLLVWGVEGVRLAWKRRSAAGRPEHGSANERYFEVAGNEVVSGNLKPGLWARALAGAGGDESKAKAAYIKARVRELADAAQPSIGEDKTTGGLPPREHTLSPNPESAQEGQPNLNNAAATHCKTGPGLAGETDQRREGEAEQGGTHKPEEESAVSATVTPLAASGEPNLWLRPVPQSLVNRFLSIILLLLAVFGVVIALKPTARVQDSPVTVNVRPPGEADARRRPDFDTLHYGFSNLYFSGEPEAFKKWEAEAQMKFGALRSRAENGEASAQDELGLEYEGPSLESKLLLQQNWSEALKWYRKACEQEFPSAQYHLGRMYYLGTGVARDYTQAYKLYEKAAEQGFVDAQFAVAGMLYSGRGTSPDKAGAFSLYMKCAEQGNTAAQLLVGRMLNRGDGVNQDFAAALTWFRKCAEQSDSRTVGAAGNIYVYSKAALWLGHMYDIGQGVTKDPTEAAKWYQEVVPGDGYDKAQCRLGEMYYRGEGVAQDYFKAVRYFNSAAQLTNGQAQYCLGLAAAEGKGLTQDASEAAKWYYEAASRGHPSAQAKLGQAYAAGSGVARDCVEAYKWELLAVANGNTNAVQDLFALGTRLAPDQISEAKRRAAELILSRP